MKTKIEEKNPVVLKSIKIERESWGKREGQYTCEVAIKSDDARMYLDVSEKFTEAVFQKCAHELILALQETANEFVAGIAQSAKLKDVNLPPQEKKSFFKLIKDKNEEEL